MMAAMSVYCNCTCNSLDRLQLFRFSFSSPRFRSSNILHTASYGGGGRGSRLVWRPRRVYCKSETEEPKLRKCAPVLESALLSSDEILASDDWRVVPDIWKSSTERYGDRTALVDPYHDPPTKLTYKELEQEILNFCEGLRVMGVEPDEKLALFADNSCRWLVADQGIMASGAINVVRGTRSANEELLQIYNHSERTPTHVSIIADTTMVIPAEATLVSYQKSKSF